MCPFDPLVAGPPSPAEPGRAPVAAPGLPAPAPTRPAQVTPETPLAALDLNWREQDLPERERTRHVHRLHPYLGKFIPQLAEVFLRRYFQPGQVVLDPFMGSGTTLIQANELGMHGVGCDVSAFNVLLGRAKAAVYDRARLEEELPRILTALQAELAAPWRADDLMRRLETRTGGRRAAMDYLRAWFAPQALHELLVFHALTGQYAHQALWQVVLSRAARSARQTTHFELDFPRQPQTGRYYCHKHRHECVPVTTAAPFLARYGHDTLARIRAFAQVRTPARIDILHADSRQAAFPAADGILTSPPYVGLIDYHEQHAYAYHLLGLEDCRGAEIGAAAGGAGRSARQAYQAGIAAALKNASRALSSGSPVIIVVADRYGLYDAIAGQAGLCVEDRVVRQVERRTGRRAGGFAESILVWRKP